MRGRTSYGRVHPAGPSNHSAIPELARRAATRGARRMAARARTTARLLCRSNASVLPARCFLAVDSSFLPLWRFIRVDSSFAPPQCFRRVDSHVLLMRGMGRVGLAESASGGRMDESTHL